MKCVIISASCISIIFKCATKIHKFTDSYSLLSTVKIIENNKMLACSSTLSLETTSTGIMNKLKRTDEHYFGLLMCVL